MNQHGQKGLEWWLARDHGTKEGRFIRFLKSGQDQWAILLDFKLKCHCRECHPPVSEDLVVGDVPAFSDFSRPIDHLVGSDVTVANEHVEPTLLRSPNIMKSFRKIWFTTMPPQ